MTPHLTIGPVATSLDARIENLLLAFRSDETDAGQALAWALRSWQVARAGLEAVKEVADDPDAMEHKVAEELRDIVREGLEAVSDE